MVLANEFLCCQMAEQLALPINRAVLVSIDERILALPRRDGRLTPSFTAGIRCGMIRFENPDGADAAAIGTLCENASELHAVIVFEQLVCRNDGRQLLIYPIDGTTTKRFGAFDYGFAFGGQPMWSAATLAALPRPNLPGADPFAGQPYKDGSQLTPIIENLRTLSLEQLHVILSRLHPPRWGVTPADIDALALVLYQRAQILVSDFDARHPPQLEVPNV